AGDTEAEQPPAVSRGRREVWRLPGGGDRRAQGEDRSRRDVARAPSAAVDAPASERPVDMGPLRRRPPRRQQRLRGGVQPIPRCARRPVDLLLDDRRGASRRRRPPGAHGHGTAQAVPPPLMPPRTGRSATWPGRSAGAYSVIGRPVTATRSIRFAAVTVPGRAISRAEILS